jgi:glucose-1-phosphate adenylyltransferase
MPGVTVGRRCDINNCIIDEGCVIPDGMQIGHSRDADQKRFFVTNRGVVLVTPDMLRSMP